MTAYIVFIRDLMLKPDEFAKYVELLPAAREGHALTALAAYGKFEVLEGDPIEGAVIVQFPSFAEAKAWYDSPAYQKAVEHRFAAAQYRAFIIEGVG